VSWGCCHAGYWNGSLVAVKVLEQVAGDFNPRSSLEPLLHHRLSHPNVVAMFDVCTQVCVGGELSILLLMREYQTWSSNHHKPDSVTGVYTYVPLQKGLR
jgi:hypothetical protein